MPIIASQQKEHRNIKGQVALAQIEPGNSSSSCTREKRLPCPNLTRSIRLVSSVPKANQRPLILLHGGPGTSESSLFRHYNSARKNHFLVFYWERRGTGGSFHLDIPPAFMTTAQFVRDLDEAVEMVRQRFERIIVLLGHSSGTVLGTIYTTLHPEKVSAYIGISQIADVSQGRHLSYAFAVAEARKRRNSKAIFGLSVAM